MVPSVALAALVVAATACAGATETAEEASAPTVEAATVEAPTVEAATVEAAAEEDSLTAHPWQWVALTDPMQLVEIEDPGAYVLTFGADGRLGIVADCNTGSGTYTTEENRLTVTVDEISEAACAEDSRGLELVRLLPSAALYFVEDGLLFIDLMADGGTLSFAPAEEGIMTDKGETGSADKPAYVTDLEKAYGAPSQAGFGSAVFYEKLAASDDLEKAALAKYEHFVGQLWERYGEEAWMGPWKEVYSRGADTTHDVVAELRGIGDSDAQLSVPMVLDVVEGSEEARAALAAAFDDPATTELKAYNLGDGEAMSGILIAGRRPETGETTFLVFLLD